MGNYSKANEEYRFLRNVIDSHAVETLKQKRRQMLSSLVTMKIING